MKTVVITGPSGSGKTFLANKLSNDIDNAIIINTDSYYRDNLFIKFLSIFIHEIYDRLISIKTNEINKSIESIYRMEEFITLYNYDFRSKKSTRIIRNNHFNKYKIIIIEGIFSHRLVLNYNKTINILCNENKYICYKRRLNRDKLDRGRDRNEVNIRFKKSWDLYYKNLTRYLSNNEVYKIKEFDKRFYKKLISKIKGI